jgi:glycosyltransferase involved in cell wall biosynthesis
MKVSIATICMNQAAFVSQAIESVLAQDHDDVEYIVVDAGSNDGSRETICRYSDRITHVVFEPDDGPADGLNKALRIATGEVWACLNADDLLLPHAAATAASYFERDPSVDVVYGDGYIADAHARIIRQERSDDFSIWRHAFGIGMVVQQSTFIKRSAVQSVGGYNAGNRTCWDGELLLELALAGSRFRRVEDAWGVFRIHPDSITGSGRVVQQYESDRRRLFRRATGRPWRASDVAIVSGARAFKAFANLRRSPLGRRALRGSPVVTQQ